MKEYKMVYLNKGLRMSREKDLDVAESVVNEYVQKGWELQQVVSPSDGMGAMVGIFCREKDAYNY